MSNSSLLFLRYRLPAILWALLIFAGSSIPSQIFPSIKIFNFDKFIHIIIFYVFGILVYRALRSYGLDRSFQVKHAFITILIVMLYGVTDELHQHYVPGRMPDIWDASADTFGAILAMLTTYIYYRLKARKS